MKKLRLDLEDLRIDSFEPAAPGGAKRGTVFGQDTCGPTGDTSHDSCDGMWTCTICTTSQHAYC